VDPLRIFDIPFVGLTEGDHSYEYSLDRTFFEEFGNEDLYDSTFQVTADLNKKSSFMELSLSFKGVCTVPCDRCDQLVGLPLSGEYFTVIRFGEGSREDEDVIYLPVNEQILNVAQVIFESVALSLPSKRKHKKKDCDPAALKALEELGRNSNEENDPRWAALKELKNKEDK